MLRFISVFAVLALLTVAGAIDTSAGVHQPRVPLPDDVGPGMFVSELEIPAYLALEEVQRCVVNGLVARHWQIVERSDSEVVGYLNHRSYEARVTFLVGEGKVRVYCVGYVVSKKGERVKPHIPADWIKFVGQDIRIAFGVDPETGGVVDEIKLARLRSDLSERVSKSPSRADAW